MIAIDQMKRGLPPAGFTFARTGRGEDGEWSVVEDKTATAGLAIEQTSTDCTGCVCYCAGDDVSDASGTSSA
jgi:hypothetical protein